MTDTFTKESDLVAAFCVQLEKSLRKNPWTFYHETAGFDLLLANKENGIQVGLEAKLSLNVKVLSQALPSHEHWQPTGPDYRGVLVPAGKIQHDISGIAMRLGLGVIGLDYQPKYSSRTFHMPDEDNEWSASAWFPWLPVERCKLPDYIPDVEGGKPSPVSLTLWKIKAIKLMLILERRGFVTRKDMQALGISPTAWTQRGGYLMPGLHGYVRHEKTPDFKKQHPTNWTQIETDFETWVPSITKAIGGMAA
jgi:hypothetical protein